MMKCKETTQFQRDKTTRQHTSINNNTTTQILLQNLMVKIQQITNYTITKILISLALKMAKKIQTITGEYVHILKL